MAINKEDFLEKDLRRALAEYRAAWACLTRMEEKLVEGDLEEVKITNEDLRNSIHALERLQSRKEHNDRLRATVDDFAKRGIDLTIVKRVIS